MAGAFAQKFLNWCPWTIQVEPWLGTFQHDAEPNRGPAVAMKCQIEERITMVRDQTGNQRVSSTKLIIIGGPLSPFDRITMPADYKGHSQPPIITVSNVSDVTAFSHSEVYL